MNFKCGQNGNRASSWKIKADPVSCFTVGKRGGDTKQGNILEEAGRAKFGDLMNR